jgi:hypothetical protein
VIGVLAVLTVVRAIITIPELFSAEVLDNAIGTMKRIFAMDPLVNFLVFILITLSGPLAQSHVCPMAIRVINPSNIESPPESPVLLTTIACSLLRRNRKSAMFQLVTECV